AFVAYVAIRRITGSVPGALVGGAVYGFSPFMLVHGLGHAQLIIALFPPLVLLLLHDLGTGRRSPRSAGLLLGAAAAAQLLTGEEILAMTALTAAVGVLALAV